ncbi:hypothetical protein, partial [Achromobacter mucicolens]|uniref:hypothetical protein n=1 Tax=Achromobacter mucicolens TaxID=1389922 RepID=UPI002449FD58
RVFGLRATRPVVGEGNLRGRRIAAARAAAIGIGAVGRREGVRFALAVIGLLMAAVTMGEWAVMGGAATGRHSLPIGSRRPSGT